MARWLSCHERELPDTEERSRGSFPRSHDSVSESKLIPLTAFQKMTPKSLFTLQLPWGTNVE